MKEVTLNFVCNSNGILQKYKDAKEKSDYQEQNLPLNLLFWDLTRNSQGTLSIFLETGFDPTLHEHTFDPQ